MVKSISKVIGKFPEVSKFANPMLNKTMSMTEFNKTFWSWSENNNYIMILIKRFISISK